MEQAVTLAAVVNRANQLNPNNWRYWVVRGFPARPEDWAVLVSSVGSAQAATQSMFRIARNAILTAAPFVSPAQNIFCGPAIAIIAATTGIAYWWYGRETNEEDPARD